eukprot:UN23395
MRHLESSKMSSYLKPSFAQTKNHNLKINFHSKQEEEKLKAFDQQRFPSKLTLRSRDKLKWNISVDNLTRTFQDICGFQRTQEKNENLCFFGCNALMIK